MSLVGGVHHVSLNVTDVDEALAFYEGVLGLDRTTRPDFGFPGAWLDAGGVQIHLIEVAEATEDRGQHFAFRVDDIEAVHARLTDLGVEASPPASFPGAGTQSFLHDPAGNLIELNQPDAPA